MSKAKKALARLLARPKDFTWDEAVSLLRNCDFDLLPNKGGSHRTFYNAKRDVIFNAVQPHPAPVLKRYQVESLIEILQSHGYTDDN